MQNIKMEKWHNGTGITLRVNHPHSPSRLTVISLDSTDVEKLHSLLEDYRNAPSPYKLIETPEPEPCPTQCTFRIRNEFGQWTCSNCPRTWTAPDGGRRMQPSETIRLVLEKDAKEGCARRTSAGSQVTCNARAVRVITIGQRLFNQCRGCGTINLCPCASCDAPATTTMNQDTLCESCCARRESLEEAAPTTLTEVEIATGQTNLPATGHRDALKYELQADFEHQPLHDGMKHRADATLKEATLQLDDADLLPWLREFCTDAAHPAFASDTLKCVARLTPAVGTPTWRANLVEDMLQNLDVQMREAAVQASEHWQDRRIINMLRKHRDPDDRIQQYIDAVIKALTKNGDEDRDEDSKLR